MKKLLISIQLDGGEVIAHLHIYDKDIDRGISLVFSAEYDGDGTLVKDQPGMTERRADVIRSLVTELIENAKLPN